MPKILRLNPKYFKRIKKTPDDSEKNPKESQRIPIGNNNSTVLNGKKT